MIDKQFYTDIPTWVDGTWTSTTFSSLTKFREFVHPLFKIPGEYSFDETTLLFNEQGRKFRKDGYYCDAAFKSKDYIEYWDSQKEKCRKGVIFKKGKKTWYLPRTYYQWINYLPINDKVKKRHDFPEVWDSQYHLALYELLAELFDEDVALLKKRQWGSSFFHTADLINQIWFEEGVVLKMGASLKDYVNEKGSWKFLESYRTFLNEHTAWYRPMNPAKVGMWHQQIEVTVNDRKSKKGLGGTLQMVTHATDETSGVGGLITIYYHEEGGIAPKMDKTVEYLFPALWSGQIKTGMFKTAGSVGDLDQCEPLKAMILNPKGNGIYAVETNLLDEHGTIGLTGLFVPEQWSMPPFIDKWGNSLVKEALESIEKQRVGWRKDLTAEAYQLRISQHPTNIAEAFAYRKASKFPLHLVAAQKQRIESKTYPTEFVELSRDEQGKVVYRQTNKLPISEFPLSKKSENKEGVVVIYERPPNNPEFHAYYGSVDPVNVGATTTSESLVSIQIYKNDVEVTRIENGVSKTFVEGGKLVAEWCGRFDDPNKNHEQLAMLIELYNAWTTVENNITGFIQHMIEKNKQKYLVPSDQMVSNKDMSATSNTFQKYGWTNRGTIFKELYLGYVVAHMKEEMAHETLTDGTIVKTTYGVERIPSIMLLKEMEAYQDGGNYDRLVSWGALMTFVKIQQSNKGYKKRLDDFDKDKDKNRQDVNPYAVKKSAFNHLGHQQKGAQHRPDRRPFKNFG